MCYTLHVASEKAHAVFNPFDFDKKGDQHKINIVNKRQINF